jgi:cytochrome P450
MKKYMDLLINNLREDAEQNRTVNMVSYLNFLTFDLIGDLSFASPFDALKTRKEHPWMVTFFKSVTEGTILGQLAGFPLLLPFLALFYVPLRQSGRQQIKYTKQKVAERIDGGSERPDFMAQVLKNNDFADADKGMTRAEVDVTFNILMIAGSETTATLLSGCVYMLARDKRVADILKEEVRGAFEDANEITVTKVRCLNLTAALRDKVNARTGQPTALPPRSYRRSTPNLPSSPNFTLAHHAP